MLLFFGYLLEYFILSGTLPRREGTVPGETDLQQAGRQAGRRGLVHEVTGQRTGGVWRLDSSGSSLSALEMVSCEAWKRPVCCQRGTCLGQMKLRGGQRWSNCGEEFSNKWGSPPTESELLGLLQALAAHTSFTDLRDLWIWWEAGVDD